jgi:hypothetical protein
LNNWFSAWLAKNAPVHPSTDTSTVRRRDRLGGMIHEYELVPAA